MDNIIELKSVTKKYGKKVALCDVNLSLGTGKIIGLLGPNGSGKTTLIKTIMRIIRQQKGEIYICGQKASYETRKYISFMPDREFLYDSMKVKDAIEYYQDMFIDFDSNRAYELCNKLKISTEDKINELSKGNKEKATLILTLSRKVPIYLLDEPLGSLDPVIKHEMLTIIKQTSNENNLILISTHLIKDTESILDHALFLNRGEIAADFDIKDFGKDLEAYYLEVFSNV